jgi:putative Mg2+ transporter-C (MgtC) family protein
MDIFDSNWLSQLEISLSILIAAVLGGIVGMEREMSNRPAGLRTHALLAAAACLLVGLGDALVEHFATQSVVSTLRADPIRIVEAIVTGTAFLGAGTIFRRGETSHVEGLTTAASLLLVAGIGVAVGLYQLLLAACCTVLALLLLRFGRKAEV